MLVRFVGPGAESLLPSVESAPGVVTATEQTDFAELAVRCSEAEVYLADVSVEDVHWLASVAHPPRGIVLVVPLTIRTARFVPAVAELGVSIRWAEEMQTAELPARLELTWLRTLDEVAETSGLSPTARRAILVIRSSSRPPRSVRELADRLSLSAGTLRYYWRRDGVGPSLKDILSWNQLIRSIRLARDDTWERTAYRLGVHRRTLERLSHRMARESLGRLAADTGKATAALETWIRESGLG